MSEGTKLQHLLRGLKGSLVKKVHPFLKPASPSSNFVTKEELQQFKKDLSSELHGELNSTLKV